MPMGNPNWTPGQSGNPSGRPPGTRNKRTEAIWGRLEARGDKDPADFLSELVTSENEPKELRAAAANYLMPYKYGKRGTIPVARFVPDQIDVPTFNTVQEAEAYLAHIPVLLGRAEIDSQTALELSTLTKNWLDSIYARQGYELKLAAQGGGDATIRIEGALSPLPGTHINMTNELTLPHNGHTIDHEAVQAVIPVHGSVEPPKSDPLIESLPPQSEGQK
jgi:hypothetical protein